MIPSFSGSPEPSQAELYGCELQGKPSARVRPGKSLPWRAAVGVGLARRPRIQRGEGSGIGMGRVGAGGRLGGRLPHAERPAGIPREWGCPAGNGGVLSSGLGCPWDGCWAGNGNVLPGMWVLCRECGCSFHGKSILQGIRVSCRECGCPAWDVGAVQGRAGSPFPGQSPLEMSPPFLPAPPATPRDGCSSPWEAPEVVLFSPNPCFPWDFGVRAVPVLGSSEP